MEVFPLKSLEGTDYKRLFSACLCETLAAIIELGLTSPMTRNQ